MHFLTRETTWASLFSLWTNIHLDKLLAECKTVQLEWGLIVLVFPQSFKFKSSTAVERFPHSATYKTRQASNNFKLPVWISMVFWTKHRQQQAEEHHHKTQTNHHYNWGKKKKCSNNYKQFKPFCSLDLKKKHYISRFTNHGVPLGSWWLRMNDSSRIQ